jgi:two-component system sensor histidine kinase RegB
VVLRWLGLAGQAVAVFTTAGLLRIQIPVGPCLGLIGASAIFNFIIGLTPAMRRAARPWEASAQLGFDILQLGGLLYLTGGIGNPFCLLLIAPVTVAAANLPARYAVALGVGATLLAMALTVWSEPMPWAPYETLQLPSTYRAGCLLAVMVGIYFTGVYAFRVANEARRMELALHVTESVLAREQRLSALGALAAAAAHELGTPLATITIIAKELARETPEGPLREDAWLLIEQCQRCRDILHQLSETPDAGDVIHERMTLLQFLREMIEPHADKESVRTEAVVTGPSGMPAPDLWRRPEILHAMTSFVDNAFDFAAQEILVTARFDARSIALEVQDDGPGFSSEVLAKLGEPYITSRPGAEGSRTGHVGMGLGFFIAKTLLERTGATVEFRNGRRAGAIVTARWARSQIEAAPLETVEGTALKA